MAIVAEPGLPLDGDGQGGSAIIATTETAAVIAALAGNVYTISGAVAIGGNGRAALNFDLTESVILRRAKAEGSGTQNIEIVVFNQDSTGTFIETISPVNVNACSTNTTTVTADLLGSDAVPAGSVTEFGVNNIESPVAIGCEGGSMSVILDRRDAGSSETVLFALTFEVLAQRPGTATPSPKLKADTFLETFTEMSTYG